MNNKLLAQLSTQLPQHGCKVATRDQASNTAT